MFLFVLLFRVIYIYIKDGTGGGEGNAHFAALEVLPTTRVYMYCTYVRRRTLH